MGSEDKNLDDLLKSIPEEDQSGIRRMLESLSGFSKGTNDTCPICQQKVEEMKQVGRSVYGYPCGHRLYQGKIPQNWK